MNLEELKKPFPPEDIEWRVQSAGTTKEGKPWARVLAYVTNRAIMDRLDNTVGPENWKNEFTQWYDKSALCGLSIKIDGEWITKWDGASQTDIEAVKGGISSAMKRTAVQWGIGRYLYNLDAGFANINDNGNHFQPKKDGKYPAFKWDAPELPKWALPEKEKPDGDFKALSELIGKVDSIPKFSQIVKTIGTRSWTSEEQTAIDILVKEKEEALNG